MEKKIRWGVLSTARIGVNKVIPAMQSGSFCEVTAIASRNLPQAQQAADKLGIAKAYGSYEALLADPEIDAIYNPLPNDLHVPWTIQAARAGKHVLCEKPIALNAEEAASLLPVQAETGMKIGEAFMVKLHPQWLRCHELVAEGRIGEPRLITGNFSYFNDDSANIRNNTAQGGGGLMDIGCYLVFAARQVFQQEPERVMALIDRDPVYGVDRRTSFMLAFPGGRQATFTCSTQLIPNQRVQVFGTTGRIEVEVPVNIAGDTAARILIDPVGDLLGKEITVETFPAVDQYTLQGDAFSRAILDNTEVPVPVEAAILNMKVIDALFRSAHSGSWGKP